MTETNSLLKSRYLLKFAEVLILFFMVPTGLLQWAGAAGSWEYGVVSHTASALIALGIMLGVSGLVAYFWQKRGGGEKLHSIFQWIILFYLAFSISGYGAAKILHTQFQPPNYVLDTPIGDLSGFWLTWTYYGYSRMMGLILGWTQVIGCFLLLFRRTRLLAVFILLPVMVNIDLIDHFYKISPEAYYNALHYTFILVVFLLMDYEVLKAAFFGVGEKIRGGFGRLVMNILRVGVIALAFGNIWLLRGGFTHRTAINGVWKVDSLVQNRFTLGQRMKDPTWSKLYFEWRYGCLFKADPAAFSEKDQSGMYNVDEKKNLVRIAFYGDEKKKEDSLVLRYYFLSDSLVNMVSQDRVDTMRLYLRRVK